MTGRKDRSDYVAWETARVSDLLNGADRIHSFRELWELDVGTVRLLEYTFVLPAWFYRHHGVLLFGK